MRELSGIDSALITKLAAVYVHAGFAFRVEPMEAPAKQQKKIRKWICGQYAELVRELPESADFFSPEYKDGEVLLFLKECLNSDKALAKEKDEKLEKDFSAWDASSKSALKCLLASEFWPEIQVDGQDVQILTEDTPAFRRTLTLKNADAVPRGKEGCFCRNLGAVLKKEENRFCIYGELVDPAEETAEPFALTFESASVKTEVFNACHAVAFWDNPWDFLRTISFGIAMKADIPGEYCSRGEKALLPLIREIVALEYWMELPKSDYVSFCRLKALAAQYGYTQAAALLGKLETIAPGSDAYNTAVKKLIALLCEQRCEPLWREIFRQLEASQSAYPDKVEALCDKALLASVRRKIQERMEEKGYTGTYPDFVKDGVLEGIHLEQAYNMTYFVGPEKHAQYFVHCAEYFDENAYLTVQFLCGTALLKKGEKGTDIYGCLFRAGGRRLFHTVHGVIPLQNAEETAWEDLEISLDIAVKKAECQKLSKAEKKQYYGNTIPGFGMFLRIFLVAGGMFGVAMTLIALLLCVLATAAFGRFSDIPEMLKAIPWGLLLAIGWIGFGGAMGIAEVLARRK